MRENQPPCRISTITEIKSLEALNHGNALSDLQASSKLLLFFFLYFHRLTILCKKTFLRTTWKLIKLMDLCTFPLSSCTTEGITNNCLVQQKQTSSANQALRDIKICGHQDSPAGRAFHYFLIRPPPGASGASYIRLNHSSFQEKVGPKARSSGSHL